METVLVIVIIVLFMGIVVYSRLKKKRGKKNGKPSQNLLIGQTPSKLKGFSFQYVPFKWDWKPFIDLFAEYKVNHTRIFCMGNPGADWVEDNADWYPWAGGWDDPVDILDKDKLQQMVDFVKYCVSKGIWVHVDLVIAQYDRLVKDWYAGGDRKARVKNYMFQVCNALKDATDNCVIIGLGNEVGAEEPYGDIQQQIFDEVIIHLHTDSWTAAWHTHARPTTFVTMHELCDENHCHSGITSNDNPSVIKYLFTRHHIYKNIMNNIMRCPEPKEGFEWLTFWGKDGKCNTPEKVRQEWGDVMEFNKTL